MRKVHGKADENWRRLSFRFRNLLMKVATKPSMRTEIGMFVSKQNHVRSFIKPNEHVVASVCLPPVYGCRVAETGG